MKIEIFVNYVTQYLRIFTTRYADDFALLVREKCEEVLPDRLMEGLRKVKCEDKSLRVNLTKTEIVVGAQLFHLMGFMHLVALVVQLGCTYQIQKPLVHLQTVGYAMTNCV